MPENTSRSDRGREATEAELQRAHYVRAVAGYPSAHLTPGEEHYLVLAMLAGAMEYLGAQSVLEIGAGTGHSMAYLKSKFPQARVLGVEPVRELREVAYHKGIASTDLVPGSALDLQFETASIDVICAFSVLHHVREPSRAVAEMLRVSRKAVFISDGNNFGQGGFLARSVKQLLNAGRLWKVADWIKTRGKGYTISEGDGLAYSYSVFNDYQLLKSSCRAVHVMNTTPAGVNPYRTASHVSLLAIR